MIRLFNDDCNVVLDELISNGVKFDHIITDPPYNIKFAEWDTFLNIEEITNKWFELLKEDGSIFCFTGWSFAPTLIKKFDDRFTLKDWIIYDRIKGRGGKKSLTSTREDLLWYIKSNEYTFHKKNAYSTIPKKTGGLGTKNGQKNRSLSNVWTDISPIVPWSKERVKHPTQKPVKIMERILNVFTNKDDLILDCFMGSGTTGVACKNMERNFIGIELNKDYFEIAKNRIFEK